MHSTIKGHWARALLCVAVLTLPLAHARELAPIDALGEAPLAVQRKAAQALPAQVQSLSREERLGLPTFARLRPSAARARAAGGGDPASAARGQLKALAGLYGLTPQEVDAAPVHHVQTLPGGARLVRLTNQRDGIEVFREQATVLLDAQSQATAIGGYLSGTAPAPASTLKAAPSQPLWAVDAVARALQDWDFDPTVAQQLQAQPRDGAGPYQWWTLPQGVQGAQGATLSHPARSKPVWFRLPQGLVPAHYVEVQVSEDGEHHAYAYVVASDDGRLLLRHSQTAHQHSYRAWAEPAAPYTPLPGAQGRNGTPHPTGTPNGYGAPLEGANLVTLSNVPFSQNDPWLPANATQTNGNNVHAYADLNAPDGWNAGDVIATTTSQNVFDYGYDHTLGAQANPTQVAASVVNLFYVTNWLHDWFYDVGFDEASGNAQADNFGRGGLGGDAMRAEALDYSGTNNANMLTPADGAPPRMQMYRFVNDIPPQAEVVAPSGVAGAVGSMRGAAFGPQVFDLTADVVDVAPANGCTAFAAGSLMGQIALLDRGGCNFSQKVLNAENAGAVGVVVVNNVGEAPIRMGTGVGAPIIPSIHIAQATGAAWRSAGGTIRLHMQGTGGTVERSSALDNAIIAHEWGHYISNRLIGNSSGLTTNHARGLGEGWGDFHALLMTVSAQDISVPGNANWMGAYGTAAYAVGAVDGGSDPTNVPLWGLRRYPYSSDMGKNPLTLKHITDGVALPATPPRNSNSHLNAEVHNAGEVWTTMLWEFYTELLRAHPFQQAQDRMKQYLVTGYKLTPSAPTLLEARDALLAAAHANDPADYQRGAVAFAKRGAGSLAQVPDRYSTTNAGVVESFGVDGVLALTDLQLSMTAPQAQRCDADDVLDNGETGVVAIGIRNQGFSTISDGLLTLSANVAGVQFPDGVVAVPAVAPGTTVTVTARVRLAGLTAPGGTRITASLAHAGQVAGPVTGTLDLPLHRDILPASLATDDAEALPSVMEFGSTAAGQQDAWSVKGYGALDHRYAGSTPATAGSHWMRTPVLQVAASGNFEVSFRHRHRFEKDVNNYYDGGQLMISTDGGAHWTRVAGTGGALFTGADNPASGQQAYVGDSPGWPAMAIATVNLGTAYAGQTVRLAWVVHTDQAVATEGWEVDDIVFTGITNTPFPRVVADAQLCVGPASLSAQSGTPQAAPVGEVFQPLRVRLLDATSTPLAGAGVTFTVPASGATAVLSSATAVTDGSGYATVNATAGGVQGSYTVTASAVGASVGFALRNTAGPVGTGGGGGPLVISGPAPDGQGTVTATVQAPPAHAYFSRSVFATDEVGAGVPPLGGYRFPFGVLGFALENVGVNGAITLRIQYPGPVPTGAQYRKYRAGMGWHTIPMAVVAVDTIEITLTDGGQGDTDGQADGTITDPGGLAVLAAAPVPVGAAAIPALSPFALALLAAGLGLVGWRRRRG